MNIKREHLARRIMLTATVPAEKVLDDIESCYRDSIAPDLEISGFRKGRVPRSLAEKKMNPKEMYKEVLDGYFEELLSSFPDEVVSRGDFGIAGTIDGNEDVVLNCTVTLMPQVRSLDLDSALSSVSYVSSKVPDEEIDAELLRRCKPHMVEEIGSGETLENCSSVVIDFEGRTNGMPFQGGSASGFEYTVGETQFVDGFEEQMFRIKVGGTGRVVVRFPEDYPQKTLASQKAIFSVTVKSAQMMTSKVATDEIACRSGFESLAVLREKVGIHLNGMRKHECDQMFRQSACRALVEAADCEMLSNDSLDALAESAWWQFLNQHGFSEEEYAKQACPASSDKAICAVMAQFGLDKREAKGRIFEQLQATEAIRAAKAEWKLARWNSMKEDIAFKAILSHIAEVHVITVTEAEVATRLQETQLAGDNASDALNRLDSDADFRKAATAAVVHNKTLEFLKIQCGSPRPGQKSDDSQN